ncbi:molybdopterin-dependent oxidoreductase [Salmonirosea aquatica]|uniref:Molybdopterin-dependent oxidoreductase n=1 Tax=Salmonirosea aquatica TaxID=2654236 RepID=A0A7C9BIY9_9BACT|nr:molybdopterin-dependent oxidoreductase [Cytophagaceae bacterium SJW1-29]
MSQPEKLGEENLPESDVAESEVRRRMIKSFGWFALAAAVPVGVYKWISNSPKLYALRKPLRRVLDVNAQVAQAYFSPTHLVPTFEIEKAVKKARVNGSVGLKSPLPEAWRLQVEVPQGVPLQLTLEDIKALPKHEIIYEFKCIEGWSQVQHWGGARLSDFLTQYKLGSKSGEVPHPDNTADLFAYMGLETPDKAYYVGIDVASALHPQTLLAYELNGQPLSEPHGAPLRLIIPVKYGVKNLKRIGRIFFTDERPRDYWAERGYDYYIGL